MERKTNLGRQPLERAVEFRSSFNGRNLALGLLLEAFELPSRLVGGGDGGAVRLHREREGGDGGRVEEGVRSCDVGGEDERAARASGEKWRKSDCRGERGGSDETKEALSLCLRDRTRRKGRRRCECVLDITTEVVERREEQTQRI
jgi:hypothetical protein